MNKLTFDLEVSPILGHAWQTWKTNLLSIEQDTQLISVAYKVNNTKTKVISTRLYTEEQMVDKLWELFDEADIIIGHNSDNFDNKLANRFFLRWGKDPPSPYRTVDTLKLARRYFRFSSNKLDYIAQFLFGEKKLETSMQLWFKCMAGDRAALRKMEKYNKKDVDLTYKVYETLKKWHTGHPNYNLYFDTTHQCPVCGGDTQRRGYQRTRVGIYQRYQCKKCAAWSQGEKIPHSKVIR